jgi:RNA polymerase sigma factor (sigma-70 family)
MSTASLNVPTKGHTRTPGSNPFDDLSYVFAEAGTSLLTPAEERELAERIWMARRRLRLALVWSEGLRRPTDLLPHTRPHRAPIPPGLRKRLLDSEKKARQLLKNPKALGAGMRSLLSRELGLVEESRERLLRRNLRLVAWIAKGFQRKGLELLDLFQEGAIALLWSIDRYDPARETRLSTFASHAIKLGIIRALADKGRTVRIPNYRLREVIETSSARGRLLQELGREPRVDEIASETDVERKSLDELMAAVRPTVSLDAPIAGTELTLSDVMPDFEALSPLDRAERLEAKERARGALRRLSQREQRIVAMRYGLLDCEEKSYEDIGRSLGISRERTRQLENAARGKLRQWIESGVR